MPRTRASERHRRRDERARAQLGRSPSGRGYFTCTRSSNESQFIVAVFRRLPVRLPARAGAPCSHDHFFVCFRPETMSSIRSTIAAASTAVLMEWTCGGVRDDVR